MRDIRAFACAKALRMRMRAAPAGKRQKKAESENNVLSSSSHSSLIFFWLLFFILFPRECRVPQRIAQKSSCCI
jgi:hypothetical protein